MATPKFDAIVSELAKRLGDTTTVSASGSVYTNTELISYTNKALLQFFNKYYQGVKLNPNAMATLFPELVNTVTVALSANIYTIATPNLKIIDVIGGYVASTKKLIKVWDRSLYTIAMSNDNAHYKTSTNKPALVYQNGIITVFSGTDTSTITSIVLQYLAQPVKGTGLLLDRADNEDSPFAWIWNSEIIGIAEELIKIDNQDKS